MNDDKFTYHKFSIKICILNIILYNNMIGYTFFFFLGKGLGRGCVDLDDSLQHLSQDGCNTRFLFFFGEFY